MTKPPKNDVRLNQFSKKELRELSELLHQYGKDIAGIESEEKIREELSRLADEALTSHAHFIEIKERYKSGPGGRAELLRLEARGKSFESFFEIAATIIVPIGFILAVIKVVHTNPFAKLLEESDCWTIVNPLTIVMFMLMTCFFTAMYAGPFLVVMGIIGSILDNNLNQKRNEYFKKFSQRA